MKNSVLELDSKRYGGLLARKLPAVIRTEEENERLIGELEQMNQRHDELTPEEREYSELLTVLIEAFEDANCALDGSTPDSRLRSLMEEHGLRQRDWQMQIKRVSSSRSRERIVADSDGTGTPPCTREKLWKSGATTVRNLANGSKIAPVITLST